MSYSPLLMRLIDTLRCMPGVGRKSAQRIAFHLLERDRAGAGELSSALADAVEGIGHCSRCRMLTEQALCTICATAGSASKPDMPLPLVRFLATRRVRVSCLWGRRQA